MVHWGLALAVAHVANAAFWAWAVVSGVCAGLVDIDAVGLGYRQ